MANEGPALAVTHGNIFRRYWAPILTTLGLILFSSVLWLFQPFLLGVAIDGLIADDWSGVVWLALLQVGVLTIGMTRRFYDTRVYARIYRDIAEQAVTASQEASLELTRITARAGMLREVVSFFEFSLPSSLRAVINLVGSVALLWFLSKTVLIACGVAIVLMGIIGFAFSGRIKSLSRRISDQQEREVDVISQGSRDDTREHFRRLARWQIAFSDTDVIMFGLSNVVLTSVLLFALYQTVSVDNAEVGTIFAVFSYVTRFQFAAYNLPYTYQQLVRTLEITERVNRLDDTAEGGVEKEKTPPLRTKREAASLASTLALFGMKRRR
ncbi:MAG: ABC transporter six-transmembrane domain-containing protein [Pseudomonadota bacterium]